MDEHHIPKKLDAPPTENANTKKSASKTSNQQSPATASAASPPRTGVSKNPSVTVPNVSPDKSPSAKSTSSLRKSNSKILNVLTFGVISALSDKSAASNSSASSSQGVGLSPHLLEVVEIIPDLLDSVPPDVIEVIFKDNVEVSFGNELTPAQVKDMPIKISWPHEKNNLFTLCLLDLDSPSRQTPKYREWNHWLVVNIPDNHVTSGLTLYEYISSCPPKGTGYHRYVFLVYKQPAKLTPDEKVRTSTSGEGRGSFKIKEFATKYKLGNPIAVNFYIAQFDDYVTQLYEKISGD